MVSLYEIACHVRDDAEAFEELCRHEDWHKNEKLRPLADDQVNALRHVFRLAAGFTGTVANDRSSRWNRALTPAFLQRLEPPMVHDLIGKSGGIKKLAAQNKARKKTPATPPIGVGDKTPAAGAGRERAEVDDAPCNNGMAAAWVQSLRNLEKIAIAYFLSDYTNLTPIQEGHQRQFLRNLLEDRMVHLTNGGDPAGRLLAILKPVMPT